MLLFLSASCRRSWRKKESWRCGSKCNGAFRLTLLQIMLFPLPGNPSRKQHDKPSFLPERNLPSMFYQDQICLNSCHIVEMEQVDQIDHLLGMDWQFPGRSLWHQAWSALFWAIKSSRRQSALLIKLLCWSKSAHLQAPHDFCIQFKIKVSCTLCDGAQNKHHHKVQKHICLLMVGISWMQICTLILHSLMSYFA